MPLRSRNILFYFILFLVAITSTIRGQAFKLASTLHDITSNVTCMVMSLDGKILISGDQSGNISFRDGDSGALINTVKAFNSPVDNINFNSTGRLMIVTTRDGEIKIYDFEQEKFIQSLYSPEYSDIRFALFSIADGFIYFNGQGRLYKTRSDLTQPVQKIYESDSTITNAVIAADRSALIFTCGNAVKVLNTRTDNIIQELTVSSAKIERLAWSSDNKFASWSDDGTIVLRKYEFSHLNSELLCWFKAGTCSNLVFSHDGNIMVTGRVGTWARIWKLSERNVVQELFGHKDEVTNFAFAADDQTLFTSSLDKTINVWKQKIDEIKIIPQIKDSLPKIVAVISPPKPQDSSAALVVLSGSNDPSLPIIELDRQNIPSNLGGRRIEKTTDVEVSEPTIDIYVFDNSTLDGDVMSLSFQNQWILTHYEVTKKKKKITLQLTAGSNNYLVLFADNLGKTPPNTAAISFVKDGREKIFRLQSDLKTSSAINFIYKSK